VQVSQADQIYEQGSRGKQHLQFGLGNSDSTAAKATNEKVDDYDGALFDNR